MEQNEFKGTAMASKTKFVMGTVRLFANLATTTTEPSPSLRGNKVTFKPFLGRERPFVAESEAAAQPCIKPRRQTTGSKNQSRGAQKEMGLHGHGQNGFRCGSQGPVDEKDTASERQELQGMRASTP